MDLNCSHKILFFSPGSSSDLSVVKCYIQVLQILLVQLPHPGKQLTLHASTRSLLRLYFILISHGAVGGLTAQVHGTFLLTITIFMSTNCLVQLMTE